MNLFQAFLAKIAAEFHVQRYGRRALNEIKFAKYKIAPRQSDRSVRERLLRRLPRQFGTVDWLTTV
jgi:hypothetical protein